MGASNSVGKKTAPSRSKATVSPVRRHSKAIAELRGGGGGRHAAAPQPARPLVPPPKPARPKQHGILPTKVKLRWSVPPTPARVATAAPLRVARCTGFRVQHKTRSGEWRDVAVPFPRDTTWCTVRDLQPDCLHLFRVAALSEAGQSLWSQAAAFATPPDELGHQDASSARAAPAVAEGDDDGDGTRGGQGARPAADGGGNSNGGGSRESATRVQPRPFVRGPRAAASVAEHDSSRDTIARSLGDAPVRVRQLSCGWVECLHPPSQRIYYWEPRSGITSWELPDGVVDEEAREGDGMEGRIAADTEGMLPLPEKSDRFGRKRFLFLWHLRAGAAACSSCLELHVSRSPPQQMLQESMLRLMSCDKAALCAKPRVQWRGEDGIDSGGLTKDWFLEVSRALVMPELGLFRRTPSEEADEYEIDARWQQGDLQAYRFAGRLAGKAVYERACLDFSFARFIVKELVGQTAGMNDLKSLDPQHFNGLMWLLKNRIRAPEGPSVDGAVANPEAEDNRDDSVVEIDQNFTATVELMGSMQEMELVSGGADKRVTEDNKRDYVRSAVRFRMGGTVSAQLKALRDGFHDVVPSQALKPFTPDELSLLLTGKANVDVGEWRRGAVYRGFEDSVVEQVCEGRGEGDDHHRDAQHIEWFWRALSNMSEADRRNVLRFCTGTTRIPLDGFDPPFTVTKAGDDSPDLLPTSHTCFNQLVLPCGYAEESKMREKLLFSVQHGQQGFFMT